MKCPHTGLECPRDPCPGGVDPGICKLWTALDRLRNPRPQSHFLGGVEDPSSLRVGLISGSLLLGGAEAWQLAVISALKATINFVGTVNLGPSAPAMVAELAARMPVAAGLEAARELASHCDILLTWAVIDYEALFAGLQNPPKVIFACHLPTEWGNGTEELLSGVDHFVAVSESAQKVIPSSLRGRSSIIPNAIDEGRMVAARSRDEVRRSWGVGSHTKVIGYLGRLSSEKDPAACVRLAKALPDGYAVVVVGDGPLKVEAPPNLFLVGADPDKGSVLAAFDAAFVPSRFESFGLTIAEAAWIGVPVLSTPVGIAGVTPGLTRLIPFGADGSVLADAVLTDFADANGTAERVARAREYVRAHFGTGPFGRRYGRLLASLDHRKSQAKPSLDDRLRFAAEVCPAGSGSCGCSGGPPRNCGHPDRPATVTKADCYDCQTKLWWEGEAF